MFCLFTSKCPDLVSRLASAAVIIAFLNATTPTFGAAISIPPLSNPQFDPTSQFPGMQNGDLPVLNPKIDVIMESWNLFVKASDEMASDALSFEADATPVISTRGTAGAEGSSLSKSTGIYTGLLSGGTASKPISGLARVVVSARGTYTASIRVGGTATNSKGTFAADGSTADIALPAGLILGLRFPAGAKKITGTLTSSDGPETHPQMLPAGFDKNIPFDKPGKYTVNLNTVVPAGVIAPGGDGLAFVQVTKTGAVRLAGKLADGSKLAMSGVIAGDRTFPVYVPLYRGGGFFAGVETFQTGQAAGLIAGINYLFKPANPKDRLYPAGFVLSFAAHGSL